MFWETRSHTRTGRGLCAALGLTLLAAPSLIATPPERGVRPVAASVSNGPTAEGLREMAHLLGDRPRVAGTPGAARAAVQISTLMRSWGIDVRTYEYDVWLPHASRVSVQVAGDKAAIATTAFEAEDRELPSRVNPVAAGYSASGDVLAPLVYANYGSTDDFATLRGAGVDVAGKVALIRYGRIFRGDKVRNAEAAGAAAVILFSDPADDGFARGAVYPDGPFRPPNAIQRGSVKIGAPGDPASPGRAALVGAERRAPTEGLPTIPVVAMGYADIAAMLAELEGVTAPAAWQGALSSPYRYGGMGTPVRVPVEYEESPWRRIRNVVGIVEGSRRPDEWVILGAHYDSWTRGAIDNVSGTVAMLETARVVATQALRGNRPERSLVFAAWDAEEWGLIGSTEWVEQHIGALENAVAYINLDGVAGGPYFSAVASPSLRSVLLEGADAVADPVLPGTSVLRGWRGRIPAAPIGLPGGGSDYAPFTTIAGVPAIGFGFSAASGVYHSQYDSLEFMERFGDPGYRQHKSAASLATWLMWSLGNDNVAGLDYRPLAQDLIEGLNAVRRELRLQGHERGVPGLRESWSAVGKLAVAAGRLRAQTRSAEELPVAAYDEANRHMRRALRRLLVPSSGWNQSVLLAPDPQDTYSSLLLPAVAEPLRRGDILNTAAALGDLAGSLRAVTAELEAAERALRPARRASVVAGR